LRGGRLGDVEDGAVARDGGDGLGGVDPAGRVLASRADCMGTVTYTSADPVSKSMFSHCGGVPNPTRLMYSRSFLTVSALTSPVPTVRTRVWSEPAVLLI
jgi:hypothetical protein